MFDALSLPALLACFAGAAAVVWVAGIHLSNTTDVLSSRLHIGAALGGLILLAVATNLPEIAIVTSAALAHDLGIAVGNILGGIAVQTVVLVVLDRFGVRGERPLTYQAASLVLVLEATLVIAVLAVVVMANRLPPSTMVWRFAPGGVAITVLWVVGVAIIGRAKGTLPWHAQGEAPDGQAKPRGHSKDVKETSAREKGHSTVRVAAIFGSAAVATLLGGVVLERSGEQIAAHVGMTGVLFGATILAGATALPEVSTGLTSTRLDDYQLAVSDIFGGNAFLPVLFLVATLLSGSAVIPKATGTDIYLTGLGAFLTTVYIWGLIFRPSRKVLGLGIDSLVVLVSYALGIVGLIAVAHH